MSQYRTDEITLARRVVPALRKGMLCLADRFFPGYKLWRIAERTGADFCGAPDRMRVWTSISVCQTALLSAVFLLPLPIDGTSARGLWSA